jgi:DNA-binding NarL/FixJ family response regulator
MKSKLKTLRTILIVEDQTTIRELMAERLEARGHYKVVGSTDDGKEGIELAERLKPDILILDMLLPGISGTEVMRQVCGSGSGTKVLVFSDKAERLSTRIP